MARYAEQQQRNVTSKDVGKVHKQYEALCEHLSERGIKADVRRRWRTKYTQSLTRMSITFEVSPLLDVDTEAASILGYLNNLVTKHNLPFHEIGSDAVPLEGYHHPNGHKNSCLFVYAWLVFLESRLPLHLR